MLTVAALFVAGVLGGALNAMAGGGSFVCFPALVFAGLPPVIANASSTVALFPGGLSSVVAYRDDLRPTFAGVPLWAMAAASALGGLAGAILLLSTPQRTFDAVIPWILLLATLTFAFGRGLGARLGHRLVAGPAALLAVQAVLGLYGGYFGGAVGIMMMAAWTVTTTVDVTVMNPHRALLVNAANSIAVLWFVATGHVAWASTIAAFCGAAVGGYAGARLARRMSRGVIRGVVIAVSALVTAGFFTRLL